MHEFIDRIEIGQEAAGFIAAGLRELAAVDGVHDNELALIEAFEREVGTPATRFRLGTGVDHPLDTTELRELYLRSAILLALADGTITEEEGVLIGRWAGQLDVPGDRLAELYREVKLYLLRSFRGATLYREQAEQIGRDLGLTPEDVASALD